MKLERLDEITAGYGRLKIALVGDLCLDRYFEIDPGRAEISIETGLEVHNVTRVRCQPGASGTILNNLRALGVGEIIPVAIMGDDAEGFELRRALERIPGVNLSCLVQTPERNTFSYSKPLALEPGRPPRELNRLDIKNWTPTPEALQRRIVDLVEAVAPAVDAIIVLDQVDVAETGVATRLVVSCVDEAARRHPHLLVLADSRRGLSGFNHLALKMNADELGRALGEPSRVEVEWTLAGAAKLAQGRARPVFVSMAERGIVAALGGRTWTVPAMPLRGPIDIVGAGDSVAANLAAALGVGASPPEAMRLAMLGASIVIHQLGTTGTATPAQMRELLPQSPYLED